MPPVCRRIPAVSRGADVSLRGGWEDAGMTDTPRPVENVSWPPPATSAPVPPTPVDSRGSGLGREVSSLARAGADWLLMIATAAVAVLRWVMLISIALGVSALLLSLAAVDSGDRLGS